MIKIIPIILPLVYGLAMFRLSAWRLNRTLKNQSSLLADKQLLEPIQRLADALDLESISVNIYEIEPINGLAAPDGKIFITRGFYNKFISGEVSGSELASVIAHELGHVVLRHSAEMMASSNVNSIPMWIGIFAGLLAGQTEASLASIQTGIGFILCRFFFLISRYLL